MKSFFRAMGIAMAFSAAVAACGGGGGDGGTSASTQTGIFSDSPVEGLTYVTGGVTAKTNAAGQFTYTAGQTVTFKVGDIVLGTVTPKALVTPITLVTGATNELDPTVTNISKFLQTIDDDNNPSNGIRLTTAIHTGATGRTINFAQTTVAYDADANVTTAYNAILPLTTAGTHAVVNDAGAQSHLRNTLLSVLAGAYSGSYSGTGSSGTFSVTISTAGVITGSGLEQASSFPFSINGTVASDGVANFASGAAGNATFTGSANIDTGVVSGTWTATGYGPGTFTGRK